MLSLVEIEKMVKELAHQIDAPANQLPTFGNSRNNGTPDVDLNGTDYLYEERDRDTVCMHYKTHDIEELLYRIFRDVTSKMASTYIRKVLGSTDERVRLRQDYHLVLLGKLKEEWGERLKKEIMEI